MIVSSSFLNDLSTIADSIIEEGIPIHFSTLPFLANKTSESLSDFFTSPLSLKSGFRVLALSCSKNSFDVNFSMITILNWVLLLISSQSYFK